MKKTVKILCLLLIALIALTACGKQEAVTGEEVTVKVVFDTSAVDYQGELASKELEVTILEGQSVFEATKKACEENNIAFNYDDSTTLFITGFADLNMGDMAESDGWMFLVNGEEIWEVCDKVALKNGDTLTWQFMIW